MWVGWRRRSEFGVAECGGGGWIWTGSQPNPHFLSLVYAALGYHRAGCTLAMQDYWIFSLGLFLEASTPPTKGKNPTILHSQGATSTMITQSSIQQRQKMWVWL